MRVIAGAHRGAKLVPLGNAPIRPTPDRVKESLFQILSPRLAGARVLDLFCGSGALGIECLSRGAREVVFNDVSAKSLAVLRKNLLAVRESGTVIQGDYEICLKRAAGPFDLILADPPYREELCERLLNAVAENGALCGGGLVVYESEREEPAAHEWERVDLRCYGRTKLAFFQRSGR